MPLGLKKLINANFNQKYDTVLEWNIEISSIVKSLNDLVIPSLLSTSYKSPGFYYYGRKFE